ncbi:60S ribosomal protein L6-1 [Capsicum chinense]|nr:60S ribosomal protein L6-1 [Capsicum chinense]
MADKKFPRNPNLINGIGKFFRSKMYHKNGLRVIKKKRGGKFSTHPKSTTVVAPPSTTTIKPSKFYPADDVEKSLIKISVKRVFALLWLILLLFIVEKKILLLFSKRVFAD